MKTVWSLQDGYEKLQLQIEDGNIYAMFAGQPTEGMKMINEYKEEFESTLSHNDAIRRE